LNKTIKKEFKSPSSLQSMQDNEYWIFFIQTQPYRKYFLASSIILVEIN
jgi:hypothetical protein